MGFVPSEPGVRSPGQRLSRERGMIVAHRNRVQKATQHMARTDKSPSKQTFYFTAPAATSVLLAGDFTHWEKNAVPMRRSKDGVWSVAVALTPGAHSYRFIVDGQWQDDPTCSIRVPNPFGTQDMVRQVA
jgi:1,4-alpha-glucan branching enzyme